MGVVLKATFRCIKHLWVHPNAKSGIIAPGHKPVGPDYLSVKSNKPLLLHVQIPLLSV